MNPAITGETKIDFYPMNPLIEDQPIQFEIPATSTQFTDPKFLLKVNAKIIKEDGTILDDTVRVGPVNLTLHALFSDVCLKANHTIINQLNGAYPFRAYIETVYTYSSADKNRFFGAPQMYYKDKFGSFDKLGKNENPSFDVRVEKFAKSKQVEMVGRLHCDLLLQDKLIIPGINFSVILFPTSSAFRLMSNSAEKNEKLVITSAILKVRRVNVTNTSLLEIERLLKLKPIQYPITQVIVKSSEISLMSTEISNLTLHNGKIPRLIILTTVSSEAFNGSYKNTPFNFSWKHCLQAQIEVNGKLYPPFPYKPNSSPIDLYLASLHLSRDSDTGITFDDFISKGYQILVFDLSTEEGIAPAETNGFVTVSARWEPTEISSATTLICYMVWDNTISIDAQKNVTVDFPYTVYK